METRANYVAVGIFALLALAMGFGAIYWMNRFGDDAVLVPLNVRIEGTVNGLTDGSNVLFNGIRVGRVERLTLDPDRPNVVIAHTSVNASTPLRRDSKATLGVQGLSGGGYIQLVGGTPGADRLLAGWKEGDPAPSVDADPAALADLITRVGNIASRTDRVLGDLEGFVTENRASISTTVQNVATFSQALAANAGDLDEALKGVGGIAQSLGRVSQKLDGTIVRVEQIVQAVDPAAINRSLANVETFSKSLADARGQIDNITASVGTAAKRLDGIAESVETTVKAAGTVVAAIDPENVRTALTGVSNAGTRVGEVLSKVDADSVAKTVTDFGATVAAARQAVEGIDGTKITTGVNALGDAANRAAEVVAAVEPTKVAKLVEDLSAASQGASAALSGIKPDQVAKVVDDVAATTGAARRVIEGLDADAISNAATQVGTAAAGVTQVATGIGRVTSAIDPKQVSTIVSGLADASAKASEALAGTGDGRIGKVIEDVAGVASSARQFVAGLDPSVVQGALSSAAGAATNVANFTAQLDGSGLNRAVANVSRTAEGAAKIVENIDAAQIGGAVDNVAAAATRAKEVAEGIDPAAIRGLVDQAAAASQQLAALAQAIDAKQINKAVGDVAETARGARSLVTDASKVTKVIGDRSEDIGKLVEDATSTVAGLKQVSERVEGLVASADVQQLAGDIRRTLQTVQGATAGLASSADLVSGTVNNFAKNELRATRDLINDAQQALRTINRAVRNIEEDPSRVIRGGSGSKVREARSARPRR